MNRRDFLRQSAILAAASFAFLPNLGQNKSLLAAPSLENNPELWLLSTGQNALDTALYAQISQELTPGYTLFLPMVKN